MFTERRRRLPVYLPPTLTDIQRVTSLKMLDVTVTNHLSITEHVRDVTSRCGQSMHHWRQPRQGCRGHIPPNILVEVDVKGNIPPILLRTFGYSRPILAALRSLSLNPISFGYKTPPVRFSQAGGQSAHKARPPPTLNSR